jgi:hypothetical protein
MTTSGAIAMALVVATLVVVLAVVQMAYSIVDY